MTRKEEREQFAAESVKGADKLYGYKYSIEDVESAIIDGAEWADETMLNKAYEWLKENMGNYIIEHPFFPAGSSVTVEEDKMVEDFLKAMKGE